MNDDPDYYTPCDPSADIAAALIFGAARPGDRILEIGCGTGDDALFLAQSACRVVAFDTSKICIAYAEARCTRLGLNNTCTFSVGTHSDVMNLASANESFDLVSDRLVFCNLKRHGLKLATRKQYLENIAHLIRDDGLFFLRVAAGAVADHPLRFRDIGLERGERAALDDLFQPVSLRVGQRRESTNRASKSSRWMPMRPIRGGYATASAVFLLAAKNRQRTSRSMQSA